MSGFVASFVAAACLHGACTTAAPLPPPPAAVAHVRNAGALVNRYYRRLTSERRELEAARQRACIAARVALYRRAGVPVVPGSLDYAVIVAECPF